MKRGGVYKKKFNGAYLFQFNDTPVIVAYDAIHDL